MDAARFRNDGKHHVFLWVDQSPHAPRIAKGPFGYAVRPFRNS